MPYSCPLRGTRDVQVAFSDEMRGTPVTFSVEQCNADNGTAVIQGNNALSDSGTITVCGYARTQPNRSGNLVIVGKVNGGEIARSAGFSVCAHPKTVVFKHDFSLDLDGEHYGGDLLTRYWVVGYKMVDVISDSGQKSDLDKTKLCEFIQKLRASGTFANTAPEVQAEYIATLSGNIIDHVGLSTLDSVPNFVHRLVKGSAEATQSIRFSCEWCGIPENKTSGPFIENSGYLLARTLQELPGGGTFLLDVVRTGQSVGAAFAGTVEGDGTGHILISESDGQD